MAATMEPRKHGLSLQDRVFVVGAFVASVFLLVKLYYLGVQNQFVAEGVESIGFIESQGSVKVRHPRTLSWASSSGKKSVYVGDMIFTPAQVTATLKIEEDERIQLEPESMIQVSRRLKDRVELVVLRGPVPKTSGKKWVVKKQAAPVKVVPYPVIERYAFTFKKSEELESLKLAMDEKLKVALSKHTELLEEKQSSLKALEPVTIKDYSLELISPKGGVYGAKTKSWIAFEWKPVPLAQTHYKLEVSRRATSFDKAFSFPTVKNKIDIQIEDPGRYYWRVTAEKDGIKISSKEESFEIH